ncbi:hypothetical protein GIV52_02695 [Pseudomonas syringae]|uniref:Uncharacterized protein n=3 Tax=Pseudomonas syringae group TaxID=136849 RepID=A0A9Q4A2M5_PSESX|nr:hypothetical protein [Pseudomonas syringae]MCF5474873.1 hypothetical protein [Pseudomonas syringae]MCF5484905.1 hypothetical protein [Pseudomonas syringae]MCF5489181.1 hypothetical protein [Pseudomonas syringae]MCF5493219.1 hypothetical protein [Pseudomonas syringae]
MHMQIPLPVTVSDWRYKTASSGGLTVVFAAAAGGALTLIDPKGVDQQFRYGSVGVGLGIGARLPRFGKVNLHVRGKSVGAAGATEDFPAFGQVLVADSIAARGLLREDFQGACVFIEGGVGLLGGASGSAMLFGLDPKLLAMTAATLTPMGSLLLPHDSTVRLLRSAKGVIIAAGLNVGLQAGAGATISLGGLF